MHSAYQQIGYVVHYGPVSWVCLPYSIPRNIRKENSCSCIYVRSQHSSMYYKLRGKKCWLIGYITISHFQAKSHFYTKLPVLKTRHLFTLFLSVISLISDPQLESTLICTIPIQVPHHQQLFIKCNVLYHKPIPSFYLSLVNKPENEWKLCCPNVSSYWAL